MSRSGGITYTRLGCTRRPSVASSTGMAVKRCNTAPNSECWVGDRCMMTTKPRPLSDGMCRKNCSNAASEPAEPPSATSENRSAPSWGRGAGPAVARAAGATKAGAGNAGVEGEGSEELADMAGGNNAVLAPPASQCQQAVARFQN